MEDNYTFNVDIETQKSTTSVASLRKEIKELKNVLLTAEQGTKEYNAALEQLGSDLGQIKDVNELAKASTKDFGQQMANVTGTLKGVSGGVQAITGGLSLMGVEMGEDMKVLKTLTSLMSMTEGIAAVESGIKAFKGLTTSIKTSTIAQKGLNAAMKANPIGFIIAGVTTLAAAVGMVTTAIREARDAQWELNHAMETAQAKEYIKASTKNFEDWKSALALQERIMKAQGQSEQEILEYRKSEILLQQQSLRADAKKLEQNSAYLEYLDAQKKEQEALAEWVENQYSRGRNKIRYLRAKSHREELEQSEAVQEAQKAILQNEQQRLEVADMLLATINDQKVALAQELADKKRLTQAEIDKLKKEKEAALKAWKAAGVEWEDGYGKLETSLHRLGVALGKKGNEAGVAFIDSFLKGTQEKMTAGDFMNKLAGFLVQSNIDLKKTGELGADFRAIYEALLNRDKEYTAELQLNQQTRLLNMANEKKSAEDIRKQEQEDQRKNIALEIQLLQDRLDFIISSKSKELASEKTSLEAQIANANARQVALEREITYSNAVLAADQAYIEAKKKLHGDENQTEVEAAKAYLEEKKELREQEKQIDYEFWDWQYENTWSNFEKQTVIKEAQLEAEKAYQEQLLEAAKTLGDKDTIDEIQARIQELVDELNNLNLDKSKATFKAWGDSIVKILGNVTDVMGSLMSYYQTQTDEAVADLEDKLKQNIIDQETYDKESEKLKEEQFERNKQFQIAQALINGAAGIVQIIGDASLPSYWAKLAAIAATTLTTGIEIATIRAQQYHGGKSGGGSNNPGNGENWINVAPAYQLNDGTNATTDRLDQISSNQTSQRVYILESDIQSSNRRVQVRESNTRF